MRYLYLSLLLTGCAQDYHVKQPDTSVVSTTISPPQDIDRTMDSNLLLDFPNDPWTPSVPPEKRIMVPLSESKSEVPDTVYMCSKYKAETCLHWSPAYEIMFCNKEECSVWYRKKW
jgi:hypothetical protein